MLALELSRLIVELLCRAEHLLGEAQAPATFGLLAPFGG